MSVKLEAPELLQQVINSFEHEIYIKDKQGQYIAANTYYHQRLEHLKILQPRESIVGKTDLDLFDPSIAESFRTNDLEVMASQETSINKESAKIENHHEHFFISHKTPLKDKNDSVIGIIGRSMEVMNILIEGRKIKLTRREIHCLSGIFKGMSAKEIAKKLDISNRTVESYTLQLKDKLDCHTRSDFVELILKNGIESAMKHAFS